ncbi:hypothetical protein BOTBODRAFT_181669 [Botryobasidium botryosum FD-172 SS1]|uniref:HAT C-terminal dimerisation domain-containing protein n=1 Tax=Botryobasidium botryosum (strain FD-172 SS1) TaxID=930990 RepID=A0A067LVS1_BOTB1|nr:hypothetical protein BOTBODRAFT_181669 [Botryobasidium botryosum FD-172 SS1]
MAQWPIFKFDLFLHNGHDNDTSSSEVVDQLESYLQQDSFRCQDPLAYWYKKLKAGKWPQLSWMAINHLSVPDGRSDSNRGDGEGDNGDGEGGEGDDGSEGKGKGGDADIDMDGGSDEEHEIDGDIPMSSAFF